MSVYRKNILLLQLVALLFFGTLQQNTNAQLKETVHTDYDYVLSKFSYSKTGKIARIYCKKYPETFNCKESGPIVKEMFPEDFNLTDKFFTKLFLRPVDIRNYDALNIAGLYLRNKRPEKGDVTYAYTYLDIELDSLTSRIYAHHSTLTVNDKDEIQFKMAYLSLLEENLFVITNATYTNELRACNNFEGPYYDMARGAVAQVLYRLKVIESNETVLKEINRLISLVPAEYRH